MLRAVACALLKTCTARRPHIRALACVRTRLSFQYHMYAARTVRQLTVPSIFTRYLHGSLLRTPWLTSRPLRSCRVRQRVERKPWITLAHTLRIRHFATSASDPPPAKLDLSLLTEDEKENTLVDADLLEYIPSEFVKFNMAYRNAWLLEYIAQIFPTQVAQDYLNLIHVWTHSPWWFSIILATIGIKLLTIPVMIVQEKNFMRRTMIARKINNKAAAIKGLGLSMWESFRLRWKSTTIVYKKHNISRFKMIVVPITQIPMWLTFAFGIRLMVITYPEFTEGGILWFKDLSVLDPTLILPYAAITTTYISILVAQFARPGHVFFDRMRSFFSMALILWAPYLTGLPSGFFMYWITGSLFQIAFLRIWYHPDVRKWLVKRYQMDEKALPPTAPEQKG